MHQGQPVRRRVKSKWLKYIGLFLFFFSFIPYIIAFLVPWMGLPFRKSVMIAGVLFALSATTFYVSLALLGKDIIAYGKQRLKYMMTPSIIFASYTKRKLYYGLIIMTLMAFFIFIIVVIIYI